MDGVGGELAVRMEEEGVSEYGISRGMWRHLTRPTDLKRSRSGQECRVILTCGRTW